MPRPQAGLVLAWGGLLMCRRTAIKGNCMTNKKKLVAVGGGDARSAKLHAVIARKIGESILGGEYPPGTLLPNEAEWGRVFAASRTTVREAIKSLTAKGLLHSRPKVGSRVEPKSRWNMLDRDVLAWHRTAVDRRHFMLSTQEFRRLVEPGIAELAARKRTTEQVDRLVMALEAMRKAKSHNDVVSADVAFHETLLASANNDLLAPFGILIEETLANLFDFTTSRNPRYQQALKLHENIVRAVVAEDPVAARAAMLTLISDTDRVIESLGKRRKNAGSRKPAVTH
jgi:DNA-binding FadR family transcriptional regulator